MRARKEKEAEQCRKLRSVTSGVTVAVLPLLDLEGSLIIRPHMYYERDERPELTLSRTCTPIPNSHYSPLLEWATEGF